MSLIQRTYEIMDTGGQTYMGKATQDPDPDNFWFHIIEPVLVILISDKIGIQRQGKRMLLPIKDIKYITHVDTTHPYHEMYLEATSGLITPGKSLLHGRN